MEFEDDFFFEEDKILTNSFLSPPDTIPSTDTNGVNEDLGISLTALPRANVELHQLTMMEDRITFPSESVSSSSRFELPILKEFSFYCILRYFLIACCIGVSPDIELVARDKVVTVTQLPNSQLGMTITSGNVVIQKDSSNLIGISIGGGAPLCPCLYIVQVFDNTPAAAEGTLQSGDELVAVNGASVKGKTKVEVAKMIQACDGQVSINYNKLHADPRQGRSLDIALKKVKHRLVEGMGSATADALGLSRAILCNDALVQRLAALQRTENLYRGLVAHAKATLRAFFDLTQVYKAFGDAFAAIGVREPQPRASEAFRQFGEQHRQMEKFGVAMLKAVKPILSDLGTYLHKAIPDTRLTISKYADAKFEYLSYCLKVKELDDEEQSYAALQEPLYRVETGNYEYRLVLRCRQEARSRFAKLRSDVLVKLELLDNKHVQDVVWQLQKFASGLAKCHAESRDLLSESTLFPVEVDLSRSAFQYKTTGPLQSSVDSEDGDDEEDVKTNENDETPMLDIQESVLLSTEPNQL